MRMRSILRIDFWVDGSNSRMETIPSAAELDPAGDVFPGRIDVHDPAPAGVFAPEGDQLLADVAVGLERPEDVVPLVGIVLLEAEEEAGQVLGRRERPEQAGEVRHDQRRAAGRARS